MYKPFQQLDEPDECYYCARTAYSVNLAGKADCGSCELDPVTEQNERAWWVYNVVKAANMALAFLEGHEGFGHYGKAEVVTARLREVLGPATNEGGVPTTPASP